MKNTLVIQEPILKDLSDLYTRYREFVLRICLRYVQNRHEAEDLTQEIFLKAGTAWQAFSGKSQPSTWLYRIAVNHSLDHLRWNKRQREMVDMSVHNLDNLDNLSIEDDINSVATPSCLRLILDTLQSEMDSTDQQIMYLRFELGCTHLAIAQISGVSRVAITKRLTKIIARAKDLHNNFNRELENETPVISKWA